MADLSNPRLIWLKGWLFLALGLIACAGLLLEAPSLRVAAMLAIAVWAFCRFYYFAFYVIEKYVDPGHRFTGLIDFARYAVGHRRRPDPEKPPSQGPR